MLLGKGCGLLGLLWFSGGLVLVFLGRFSLGMNGDVGSQAAWKPSFDSGRTLESRYESI